ncbi:RNA polymerase factor sigma-54 [Paramagnetospirillum magneticum]|uniref:RNA polymerase sigma-54 factor n=1 Tax=Paramagnetospirillum magneticum (strain ATCC 700264 / AMB-1) TaxID=342108 RepID=Q2W084_PARM1|nr:RNA polymerase factor sigma-54 [Paramagnetospirillum magneticum]BAE52741.1 DNA-directed RNA polymerase specialized sigma subunit [Paramagnetospirillum magneticum AMB-1]
MAIGPRLDIRQTQSLVMTPQLQQAIKLLQLSNFELTAFIDQELERNPLLEREEGERGPEPTEPKVDSTDLAVLDSAPAEAPLLDGMNGGSAEDGMDVDYDNTFNNDSASDAVQDESLGQWGNVGGGGGGFDDGESNLEQMVAGEISLRDHLAAQVSMDIPDAGDRLIALHLIEMLDEAGYLIGDLDELAERLGCPTERVLVVLKRVQGFDPVGVFARSLKECLGLQLAEKNRLDPAMQALLDNLELLARRDLPGLMKACGVDAEDMAEMIGEIKALDPKPALAFDHIVAQPVTPDVLMRRTQDGAWVVELNSDTLPRVLVNTRYYSKIAGAARSKDDKTYISERFQSANWLVKSLHQRATTILKVATEIVRQQDAFFRLGVQHLRPLVLRDIATAISMHESTVSRVTSNKYMATPRGIYELKYFFTQAIGSADGGDAHSAESVRHRIKALIDAEGKSVLSDDSIVDALKAEGIDIARRTVAKYREAMNIGSSVQRRREKSLGM